MRTLALIVLLAAFSAPALAKDKNVTVTTNRFTGKTTIVMKEFAVGPFFGFQDVTQTSTLGVLLSLGAIAEGSDNVSLVVFVTAAHWQFLNGTDVHVLADGQPIDLGRFVATNGHVETIGAVTTNEAIIAHVDRAMLDRMANAKDLQMEIGVYQVSMNPKNIQRLKEFSDALPAAIARSEHAASVDNTKPSASENTPVSSKPVSAVETQGKRLQDVPSATAPQPESLGDYARRMRAEKAVQQPQ